MGTVFKQQWKGWSFGELLWLAVASGVILGLSLFWKETLVGIVSALTGIWCVIFTGKGKRSSFLFGTVNVVLYAYLAWQAAYYGEVMLNLLYYFPMNFVGWYAWKRHMNADTGEVVKRKLSRKLGALIYGGTLAGILLYGLVLKALGGNLPFIDSTSTVCSVAAQILSVQRCTEQWVLWIFVDAVTIVMWGVHFLQGGESIATLAMWSVYLINAILMYQRWNREAMCHAV